ncbi:DUF1572 family protein [Puia sp.]|jgi:hypothetical protein|uniref:DUF1572 family protein n=1 Tax=Puia sp. TaxID=2045100 RepID=UPI002F3EA1EF
MNTLGTVYLESVIKRFLTYKVLGDMTFTQLEEKDFYFAPGDSSNSIAVIIQHMHGNMRSRWTNFLTEDGEKPGRNRDEEFSPPACSKAELIRMWEEGWRCLMETLRSLTDEDLLKTITIRREPLIAIDAINRQLAHYPHHVGQIVYIGKMILDQNWKSLSIPKGESQTFNKHMQEKHKG